MARDVVVDFDTVQQSFPGVFVPGKFRVSIIGPGDIPAPQDVDAGPVTFLQVPPGDFIAKVVRLAADGTDLGTPKIQGFNVADDTTMVAVPGSVFVTVS